jgi:hypothetical protein
MPAVWVSVFAAVAAVSMFAGGAEAQGIPEEAAARVFRLYNPATQNHLLTRDVNEAAYLPLTGWVLEGSIGRAFVDSGASPVSLTVRRPLQRLYDIRNVDHVFTTDAFEAAFLLSTGLFVDEGVIGYAVPNPEFGFVPLYRLVLDSPQKHLVTTDPGEVAALGVFGWRLEGLLGYIPGEALFPVP